MQDKAQLAEAYQRAVAANDIAAANEIADTLNALAAQDEVKTRANQPQPAPSEAQNIMEATAGATPAGAMVSQVASMVPAAVSEFVRQYGSPMMRMGGISVYKSPEELAATRELSQNLQPSMATSARLAAILASLTPQGAATQGLASVVPMAILGAAGESAAQAIEGQPDVSRVAQAAALSGASGITKTFAPSPSTLARGMQQLGAGAANAIVQGGASAGAETARTLISEGRMPTEGEIVSAASLPAVLGFGFGLGAQTGRVLRTAVTEKKLAEQAFGTSRLPASLSAPSLIGYDAAMAETRGMDIGTDAIEQRINSGFRKLFGNPIDGAEVARFLQPYVGGMDEARLAVAGLSEDALKAEAAYQDAKLAYQEAVSAAGNRVDANVQKAYERLQKASDVATAQQAKVIAENAYELQQVKMAKQFVSPAELRDVFVEKVMSPLNKVIESRADELYKQLPFSRTEEVFDAGQMLKDIRAKLKPFGKDASNEAERMLGNLMPTKADDGTLVYPRKSLEDIRKLRRDIWAKWENPAPGESQMDNKIISAMDDAIGGSTRAQMEAVFDPQTVQIYDKANAFWSAQSKAKGNEAVRALMIKNPKDAAAQAFVNDLVEKGGAADSYKGLVNYIDTVAAGDPATQQAMKSHVMDIVRAGLVNRSYGTATGEGLVDFNKLVSDVSRLQASKFPVNQLGFDETMLRGAAKIAGKAGLGKTVTTAELEELITNPAVQSMMNATPTKPNMAGVFTEMEKVADELMAYRELRSSRWDEIVGKTASARAKKIEAAKRLQKVNVSLEQAEAKLGSIEQDPLYVAMSGGKNFGLQGDGQANFRSFLTSIKSTDMTTQPEVSSLLSAVAKKSPEMRQQIALQTMSDTIEALATNQLTGQRGIDWENLGRFLDPANPAKGNLVKDRIRLIVGEEAFRGLEKQVPRLEIIRKLNAARAEVGSLRTAAGESVAVAASAARATPTSVGLAARAVQNEIARGNYKTAALILQNPFLYGLVEKGASLSDAVQRLGVQRAYLLYANNPDLLGR